MRDGVQVVLSDPSVPPRSPYVLNVLVYRGTDILLDDCEQPLVRSSSLLLTLAVFSSQRCHRPLWLFGSTRT